MVVVVNWCYCCGMAVNRNGIQQAERTIFGRSCYLGLCCSESALGCVASALTTACCCSFLRFTCVSSWAGLVVVVIDAIVGVVICVLLLSFLWLLVSFALHLLRICSGLQQPARKNQDAQQTHNLANQAKVNCYSIKTCCWYCSCNVMVTLAVAVVGSDACYGCKYGPAACCDVMLVKVALVRCDC